MRKIALILPCVFLGLAGCVEETGPRPYRPAEVSQVQHARIGTIIKVQTVEVRNTSSQNDQVAGAVVGGVVGGLIGNQLGRGSGNAVMTGAGVVGGAVIGSKLAENANTGTYLSKRWTVRMRNGDLIDVIQSDNRLHVGQTVQVVRDSRGTRLVP